MGNREGVVNMAMHYLDMLGEICPHPLLMAQAKLEKLAAGDCLVIESDFSRSVRNILAWADKNGHSYDVEEVDKGIWQVKIIKC
ncbi:MAG: sulfurtransferase TusA family protein [Negativicutes bacterium]|nr:sulfurtransferase TusA family protein [Negativicutes bacterium]